MLCLPTPRPFLLVLRARLGAITCLAAALSLLTGCGEPPAVPVDVAWSFNQLGDCETAGVRAIVFMIYDDEGAMHHEGEVACASGPPSLALPPGHYTLMADAVAYNDLHVFAGGAAFEVQGDTAVDLGTLDLGRTSQFGTADLVLQLAVGGAPACSMPDVDALRITVMSPGSDAAPFFAEWSCDNLHSLFIPELPVGEAMLDCRGVDGEGKTQVHGMWGKELEPDAVHTMGMVDLQMMD